jgi:sugar phosphate isomerase/epimerase
VAQVAGTGGRPTGLPMPTVSPDSASTPRYAVCQNALRMGGLVEDAKLASDSGAAALAVLGRELVTLGPAGVERVLDDSGLRVSTIIGLNGWSVDGASDNLADMAEAIEGAAALGSVGALVISGPALRRSPDEATSALLRRLEAASPIAVANEVPIALEPLHPIFRSISFVHTFRHAADVARRVEGVKVVVDTGHLWWDPDLLADFEAHVDLVATVQITDVDTDALAEQCYRRTQLSDGDIDLGRILPGFTSAGYDGYFENEVICSIPRDQRLSFFLRGRQIFDQIVA